MPQNQEAHRWLAEDILTDGPIQNIAYYLNLIGAGGINSGPLASRPAAGHKGAFYYATDTQILYFDNGTSWTVAISGGGVTSIGAGNAGVTIAGTASIPTVALNLANPNTWTGVQTLPLVDKGGQVFNILAYGSSTTDYSAAIVAAHGAAAAVGGGLVEYPSGVYPIITGTGVLVGNNVIHRGVGRKATVLQLSTSSATVAIVDITNLSDVAFEEIGFDWQRGVGGDVRATNTAGINWQGSIRARFTRCWFYRMPNSTLQSGYRQEEIVENCLFQDAGAPFTVACNIGASSKVGRIRGNRFHYVAEGIQLTGGNAYGVATIEDYDIDHNFMDLGWMTSIAVASGSSGTTYAFVANTSVTITDSGASFSGLTTNGNQFIRVMPVLATGSGAGVTYTQNSIVDTSAPFNTTTMFRGQLIRTGTGQFAVVASVDSTTVVRVEEWLSDTNRDWVAPPANGSNYTLYNLYIMPLTSFTSTTLVCSGAGGAGFNHNLIDLNGNAQTSVTTGTLYEVIAVVGSYPIYAQGSCKDIRIDHNTLKRSLGDMIEYDTTVAAASERISTTNNICIDGSDTGIYVLGQRCISRGNTIVHCGAVGIGVGGTATSGGDHTIDGNHCYDNGWDRLQGGVAQIYLAGTSRCQVINNHVETVSCAVALIGIGQHQSGSHVTDSNYFAGNVGVGNTGTVAGSPTADYIAMGGTVTNTGWGWNYGIGWPGVTTNIQTVSYQLVSSDAGEVIEMNAAAAVNVTVPPNATVAFGIGTVIEVCQVGAGQVSLVAGAGVTLDNPSSLATRVQFSTIGIRQRAKDEWVVSGDLA